MDASADGLPPVDDETGAPADTDVPDVDTDESPPWPVVTAADVTCPAPLVADVSVDLPEQGHHRLWFDFVDAERAPSFAGPLVCCMPNVVVEAPHMLGQLAYVVVEQAASSCVVDFVNQVELGQPPTRAQRCTFARPATPPTDLLEPTDGPSLGGCTLTAESDLPAWIARPVELPAE